VISADVLCPRPDSETLIEAALAEARRRNGVRRILDLGVGSGCLLLSLLHELAEAWGVGADASERALAIARVNAERLGLAAKTAWVCGDWGRALVGPFDLIVGNPPYIPIGDCLRLTPEVRGFEPAAALFAGSDGLDAYRAMAEDLRRLLAPDGFLCLEVGFGQASRAASIMAEAGLRPIGATRDLAGVERCLTFASR
jgi:release factor glutamine methyltransferase